MPLSKFGSFKRRYKMHISDHSEKVGKILQFISLFISLITVIAICYYHGFYLNKQTTFLIHILIFGSLLFYVVKYLISLLYSLKWITFLKETQIGRAHV